MAIPSPWGEGQGEGVRYTKTPRRLLRLHQGEDVLVLLRANDGFKLRQDCVAIDCLASA